MILPPLAAALPDDPDIVRVLIERVTPLVPEADRAMLVQVEQTLRTEYGGLRVRIPKRKKHLSDEQRDQVFKEAMTDATDAELTARYGIHRSTLYRMVKKGGRKRGE